MTIFPYMQRPEVCPCQTCQEWRADQELQRVVRVLDHWKRNVMNKRKTNLRVVK
jgi:hypothetical protein